MDNTHFKMLRRNSLKLEVDGIWDGFEELEDANEVPNNVTNAECLVLQRVLSDKTKMPRCCIGEGSESRATNVSQTQTLARRLSGGFPGAFDSRMGAPPRKELGGIVSLDECTTLKSYLAPSVGGLYLLPGACSALLQRAEELEDDKAQRENKAVYDRLKRRQTEVAKAGFPPTAC